MRIGILSDSHGRAETTTLAVAALKERGAKLLIHLGDIGTEAVLDELLSVPSRIVFGNCDWDTSGLTRYAELLGIAVEHPMGRFDSDGKSIAFTHGHLENLMQNALAEPVDYLLHGHSHCVRDERIGSTRVINPGALHRASRYTAAILEPGSDSLEIVEIDRH